MYGFMPGVALGIVEPLIAAPLRERARLAKQLAWGAFALGLLCAIVYATSDYDPRQTPIHHALGVRAMLAALSTGLLFFGLIVLQIGTGRAPRLFANRVMLWLGARSYSIYLVHIWVLLELDHLLGAGDSLATRLAVMAGIGFPLTVLSGALTYRYVELPFLQRKIRTTQHAPAEAAPAAPGPRAASRRPRGPRSPIQVDCRPMPGRLRIAALLCALLPALGLGAAEAPPSARPQRLRGEVNAAQNEFASEVTTVAQQITSKSSAAKDRKTLKKFETAIDDVVTDLRAIDVPQRSPSTTSSCRDGRLRREISTATTALSNPRRGDRRGATLDRDGDPDGQRADRRRSRRSTPSSAAALAAASRGGMPPTWIWVQAGSSSSSSSGS